MTNPVHLTISHDAPAPAVAPAAHRASAFDLVASQPWAMTPSMLEIISSIARRENDSPEAVEARLGRPLQNARKVSMHGSVAVVPMTGPVMRYANMFSEISGATSLDGLARDFTAALDDPAVTAIVLNIDSPGGQAKGIAEFAQMVRAASKPVIAYVDGSAASAAYWIAAAADEIVIAKTGEVGSIGAVIAIDPVKKTDGPIEIVSSQSPKKRVDVSTDEGRSQIQVRIDALAQVFIEDIAAYRGVSAETVLAKFGQGDVRMGADAVALGMADRVATLEEVIAGLSGTKQGQPPMRPAITHLKGANAMNLDELRAAHPDLCAALIEEGHATGLEAGAAAERGRIFDVEAQALPGHDKLIADLKADGKTTGPLAAVAVLQAERSANAGRVEALAKDAPNPVPNAAAPLDGAQDEGQSPEDKAKAKWDGDAALRAEFGGSFASFLAFDRAQASGKVRVLGARK